MKKARWTACRRREFGPLGAKEGKPATGLRSDGLKKGEIEGMNPPPKQPLGNEMKERRFVDRRSVCRLGGVS